MQDQTKQTTEIAGRFYLTQVLGVGGTATVYRAEDTELGVPRAIKLITVQGEAARRVLSERLRAEARAMARLAHPNILRIYDIGQHEQQSYVVMDLATGGSLAERLEAGGALAVPDALRWMVQVLSALSAAHAAGIVHRDVKPQNILLDRDGTALLADFGIALLTSEDALRTTRTGVAMGSLCFMAPEQRLDARSVGAQADIYACACTLYNLVTDSNPIDLFAAAPGSSRWEGVHPALRDVLIRAADYRPDRRYPDARSMAMDLLALLQTLDPDAPQGATPPPVGWSSPAAAVAERPRRAALALAVDEATRDAITYLFDAAAGAPSSALDNTAFYRETEGEPPGTQAEPATPPVAPALTSTLGHAPAPREASRVWGGFAALAILVVGLWVLQKPAPEPAPEPALEPAPASAAPSVDPSVAAAAPEPPPTAPAPAPPEAAAAPAPVRATSARPPRAPATPPAAPPEAAPSEAPSVASPLGSWQVSFNGRPAVVVLGGRPNAVRGSVSVRLSPDAAPVVTEVTGAYDPSTRALRLADQIESSDAGDYTLTLSEDLSHLSGRFVTRLGARSVPIAGRRQP